MKYLRGLQSSPGFRRFSWRKRFRRFKGFRGFRGLWWRTDGRKYKKGEPLRDRLYRKVVFASLKGATAALGG